MSNTIRYDALLTMHLARELKAGLHGQRVLGVWFRHQQRALDIGLEPHTLSWDLALGPRLQNNDVEPAGSSLPLPRKPRIQDVEAVSDERILRLRFSGGARPNATTSLVIELLPAQSNVIALDAQDRVLKILASTASRRQTRGKIYQPPDPRPRTGAAAPIPLAAWLELLARTPPGEREQMLVDRVAYVSPINAVAILGPAAFENGITQLEQAYQRYCEVRSDSAQAYLLAGHQPYGHHLWQQARPCASLLAAFALVHQPTAGDSIRKIDALLEREQRKRLRLLHELETAPQSARVLRLDADLLLAHAHEVQRGAESITLQDFQGQPRRLRLDPSLSSTANAQAWYREARKRERASQKLAGLVEECDRRIRELQDVRQRALAGETIQQAAGPPPRQKRATVEKLPYRRFRTTGGLEVRVGRSSQANDELTLRHTAPNDIWLHARAVGGAHVVLRWTDAESNPSRRDLEQAAALAALHSRARHSGVVAVDWTRRKYVRKPRNAPPGAVRVERVKTLFVSPDQDLLTALRVTAEE